MNKLTITKNDGVASVEINNPPANILTIELTYEGYITFIMRKFLALALISILTAGCTGLSVPSNKLTQKLESKFTSEVVLISDVEWKPLNPARGDKGPKAGSLWGDFTRSGPSGFLVKFVDGFSSPPHIHNIAYRGVVINGLLHNDDPDATKMWMPTGSFWTQPKGEVHITSAGNSKTMAYVEIDEGPYLVLSAKEAFDSGERPVNVDISNIVWLDASNTVWINPSETPTYTQRIEVAFLWGNPKDDGLNGTLVKLPVGFAGKIRSHGSIFRAVVIQGEPKYLRQGKAGGGKTMNPGSYFGSNGEAEHRVSCAMVKSCIIYLRMKGRFEVIPAP